MTTQCDLGEVFTIDGRIAALNPTVLEDDVISDLDKQMDVEGKDPGTVARDWMVSKGLVATG